ncbi:MAG: hypothetical protein QXR44_01590 [Thermoproteota archaeon]
MRRGLSEVVATLLLVIIVIASSTLYHVFSMRYAYTLFMKGSVSFETAALYKKGDGSCLFTCTIKNTGEKPAKKVLIKLADEAWVQLPVDEYHPLNPGCTTSISLSNGEGGLSGDYVAGLTYPLAVQATFIDESTFTTATNVQCIGVGGQPQCVYFAWTDNDYVAHVLEIEAVDFEIRRLRDYDDREKDYWWDFSGVLERDGEWLYCYLVGFVDDSYGFDLVAKVDPATLDIVDIANVTDYCWNVAFPVQIGPGEEYDPGSYTCDLWDAELYGNRLFIYLEVFYWVYIVSEDDWDFRGDYIVLALDTNTFEFIGYIDSAKVKRLYPGYYTDVYAEIEGMRICEATGELLLNVWFEYSEWWWEWYFTAIVAINPLTLEPSGKCWTLPWYCTLLHADEKYLYPSRYSLELDPNQDDNIAPRKIYKVDRESGAILGEVMVMNTLAGLKIDGVYVDGKLYIFSDLTEVSYSSSGRRLTSYFSAARIDLSRFLVEEDRLTSWTHYQFIDVYTYYFFDSMTDDKYLYYPYYFDDAVYLGKIDLSTLEINPANVPKITIPP